MMSFCGSPVAWSFAIIHRLQSLTVSGLRFLPDLVHWCAQ